MKSGCNVARNKQASVLVVLLLFNCSNLYQSPTCSALVTALLINEANQRLAECFITVFYVTCINGDP